MAPLPKKAHWAPEYIYLQAVLVAAVVWYYSWDFYNDDAFISLKFAHNLLTGNGMSWNPGERLEGYTNFLFIIITAGLGWLGVDLVLASKLVSVTAFFGIIAVVFAYATKTRPSPRAYTDSICRAICVGLCVSAVPLLTWCIGGLEGNLYAFFLCAAICLVLRIMAQKHTLAHPVMAGLCFALAALTRPDGTVFAAFTLGFMGLLWLIPTTRTRIYFGDMVVIAVVFAAIFVPYSLWRLSYFGDWLPNTYYAKLYGIDPQTIAGFGFEYVTTFLMTPPFLAFFSLFIVAVLWRLKRINVPIAYLAGIAGIYLVYIFNIGGDYMPYQRFMIPLIPVLALLIYHGCLELIPLREKMFRDLCALLLACSVAQFVTLKLQNEYSIGALSGLAVKDYVAEHWPEHSLIALNPAGALPYFEPQYRYIDMLGLLDKHIAQRGIDKALIKPDGHKWPGHLKGDGAYVLSRKPDYIIFCHAWGNDKPMFLGDLEISESPDFKKHYKKVEVYITPPAGLVPQLLIAKEKNDEAQKLAGKDLIQGLRLNVQNQLRFIYYQRKPD